MRIALTHELGLVPPLLHWPYPSLIFYSPSAYLLAYLEKNSSRYPSVVDEYTGCGTTKDLLVSRASGRRVDWSLQIELFHRTSGM